MAPEALRKSFAPVALAAAVTFGPLSAIPMRSRRRLPPPQTIVRPVPIEVHSSVLAKEIRNNINQNPTGTAVIVTRGRVTAAGVTGDDIAGIITDEFLENGVTQLRIFINDGDKNKESSVGFAHGLLVHGPLNGAQALRDVPAFSAFVKKKLKESAAAKGRGSLAPTAP